MDHDSEKLVLKNSPSSFPQITKKCFPFFFLVLAILLQFNSTLCAGKQNITFLIAEREYHTERTLPKFAQSFLSKKYRIAFCEAEKEGDGRHLLKNASAIEEADLLFLSVRRRAFSKRVMLNIKKHVGDGKPILGIRTSSHAFDLRKESLPSGHQEWKDWDREVIGGNYDGHLGKGLNCTVMGISSLNSHQILNKVELPFSTPATLYRNSPLPKPSIPLLIGTVDGFPAEPVAWIHRTSQKESFYTSLGHIEDFQKPSFNQLLKKCNNVVLGKIIRLWIQAGLQAFPPRS